METKPWKWVGIAALVIVLLVAVDILTMKIASYFQPEDKALTVLCGLVAATTTLLCVIGYIFHLEEEKAYGGQPVEEAQFIVVRTECAADECLTASSMFMSYAVAKAPDGYSAILSCSRHNVGDIVSLKYQKSRDSNDRCVRVVRT